MTTIYDASPAACARYLAYEAEIRGDLERARAWRNESWRLWDKESSLRFDPTGRAYYDNPDHDQYEGMLWISYPSSHYDQFLIETDLYIIALEYEMGEFLGVNLYTGELLES